MEFVAYLTHKYFMHGTLWKLGKDYYKNTKKASSKKTMLFLSSLQSQETP